MKLKIQTVKNTEIQEIKHKRVKCRKADLETIQRAVIVEKKVYLVFHLKSTATFFFIKYILIKSNYFIKYVFNSRLPGLKQP